MDLFSQNSIKNGLFKFLTCFLRPRIPKLSPSWARQPIFLLRGSCSSGLNCPTHKPLDGATSHGGCGGASPVGRLRPWASFASPTLDPNTRLRPVRCQVTGTLAPECVPPSVDESPCPLFSHRCGLSILTKVFLVKKMLF